MRATVSTTDYTFIVDFEICPIKPIEIYWPTIIRDLADHGLCYRQQANSIGCEWTTLQRWKNGSQPRFNNGHALLILHSKICGIALTQKRLEEFAHTNTM